jgi:hypothetical protein
MEREGFREGLPSLALPQKEREGFREGLPSLALPPEDAI